MYKKMWTRILMQIVFVLSVTITVVIFSWCYAKLGFFSLSVPPGEVEEEEQAAAEAPPVFTSQKSTASVTSSEPTGTDSHCEADCTAINTRTLNHFP